MKTLIISLLALLALSCHRDIVTHDTGWTVQMDAGSIPNPHSLRLSNYTIPPPDRKYIPDTTKCRHKWIEPILLCDPPRLDCNTSKCAECGISYNDANYWIWPPYTAESQKPKPCDHVFVARYYNLSDSTNNLIFQLLNDGGQVTLPIRECICIHCKITDICY